tara:strand:+ start:381 stop:830 length:450 start_codon:yes stop_codon:yes gene_type:complete
MKKTPHFLIVVSVAVGLALVGFFCSTLLMRTDATTIAISIFIGAFVAPFIAKKELDSSEPDVATLYVGNLPYRANETSVRELFAQYGTVHSVRLMKDKHTGKRRGFGFVEMSGSDGEDAVSGLNDTEFQQRTLKVREAKDRLERVADDI